MRNLGNDSLSFCQSSLPRIYPWWRTLSLDEMSVAWYGGLLACAVEFG